MVVAKKYDANAITILEGLEGVRKKPGMYIGPTDNRGILHLVKEIVGNSMDEVTNGHGRNIAVSIQGDTITIFDSGRGIPIGKSKNDPKLDVLTAVATKLHAGGKLDAKDGNYNTSIGSHGVGLAVVNALSTRMGIWTHRNNKIYVQQFAKGKPTSTVQTVTAAPKFNNKKWPHGGTIVQWTPDFSCFEKGAKTIPIDIRDWLKDVSWFVSSPKGKRLLPVVIEYTLSSGKYGKIEATDFKKYVLNRVKAISTEKLPIDIMGDTFMVDRTDTCDFVGAWTTSPDQHLDSACNAVRTVDGGTHLKGATKAIEDCFKKIAKKSQKFTAIDLLSGFVGCFNVRVPSPQFDSQSKNRLTLASAEKLAYDAVTDVITRWIRKNKPSALKIIDRAVALNATVIDNKLARQLASALKTKKGGKSNLPIGLRVSTTKNPEERELFVVEGESAGGTAKKASDARYQEILPLRGKILNVEKSSKMRESQPIIDILQSIGYTPSNPKAPMRVGKIMIMSDPDPDGPLHKSTLIQTAEGPKTIEFLIDNYANNEIPIDVFSRHKNGSIQKSQMIQMSSREVTNTYIKMTFEGGGEIKCTQTHKWPIANLSLTDPRINSATFNPACNLTFLPASKLIPTDRIVSRTGSVGLLSIVNYVDDYQDWYCGTVPFFGNFLVNNGVEDIVTSNCHINALCLSVLWKTVPHLFAEGKIYVVNAPLYIYSTTTDKYYGSSLNDLSRKVKGKFDPSKVTRIKGYGECSPADLHDIAFDTSTRSLIAISHPHEFASQVNQAMGTDSNYRKRLLGFRAETPA